MAYASKSNIRIKNKALTAKEWMSKHKNEILLSGELGVELDTNKMKVGDGVTPWKLLPYTMVSLNDFPQEGINDRVISADSFSKILKTQYHFILDEPKYSLKMALDKFTINEQIPNLEEPLLNCFTYKISDSTGSVASLMTVYLKKNGNIYTSINNGAISKNTSFGLPVLPVEKEYITAFTSYNSKKDVLLNVIDSDGTWYISNNGNPFIVSSTNYIKILQNAKNISKNIYLYDGDDDITNDINAGVLVNNIESLDITVDKISFSDDKVFLIGKNIFVVDKSSRVYLINCPMLNNEVDSIDYVKSPIQDFAIGYKNTIVCRYENKFSVGTFNEYSSEYVWNTYNFPKKDCKKMLYMGNSFVTITTDTVFASFDGVRWYKVCSLPTAGLTNYTVYSKITDVTDTYCVDTLVVYGMSGAYEASVKITDEMIDASVSAKYVQKYVDEKIKDIRQVPESTEMEKDYVLTNNGEYAIWKKAHDTIDSDEFVLTDSTINIGAEREKSFNDTMNGGLIFLELN